MFCKASLYTSALCVGLGMLAHGGPVEPKLRPFPLADVRLTDVALRGALDRNGRYLLSLENDSLLYAFRVNAGLPAPGVPLGGWEAPDSEVRGHFVGHYLSACALMYASTGDERFREKSAALVAGLAECQNALGDGYLSAYPTSFFDRLERGHPVWAVYYTVHKMMAGLYDQHALCGNQQALAVFKGMATYFKQRCDQFATAEELRVQLDKNEEGGVCEALWNLYSLTGDPDHRALTDKLEKRSFLDPLAMGQDNLTGRHGNTHIPLAIGAIRRYELTGEGRYLYAAAYFWDRVATARSFATGGSTDHEIWGEPFKLAHTRNDTNHETCKTYNMLKLTRALFCLTGDPRYAEFHERAYLNGILGTHGPEPGQIEYYVPMGTGYRRVFGSPLESFWCCYGTGIESFSKLADSIYFHDADNLYVSLFLPSRVRWAERQFELEQQGDLLADGRATFILHVDQPTRFGLKVRRPAWLAGSPSLQVNGEAVDASSSPWLTVTREWRNGDRVEVELPAGLHTWPLPDDPTSQAILYGPLVLAGIIDDSQAGQPLLATQNLPPQPDAARTPRIYFTADATGDVSWLRPEPGAPLRFRAADQPWPLVFKPFNRVVGERYGLYWPILPAGSDRRHRYDEENAALALLDKIERGGTPEEVARLEEEAGAALQTPGAAAFRDRIELALAAAYRQAGNADKAHTLLTPYITPFVTQSRANTIWAVTGTPQPSFTDVQPIAIDADGGDGACRSVEQEGRRAIASDLAHGRRYIYFTLPPNCLLPGLDGTVRVTVDYYATGTPGKVVVEYDAPSGAYTAAAVDSPAEKGWRTATIDCPRAQLHGRQNHGAAFRLSGAGNEDIVIGDVRLSADPAATQGVFDAFDSSGTGAVDAVVPGNGPSESAHGLKQESSATGQHLGRGYRHGQGWFGYDLKVLPDAPMALSCVYWGPDRGRVFDIAVDGHVIATQRLDEIGGQQFVEVVYPIPPELTRGKEKVSVRFTGKDGTLAGGVFGCAVKPAPPQ